MAGLFSGACSDCWNMLFKPALTAAAVIESSLHAEL